MKSDSHFCFLKDQAIFGGSVSWTPESQLFLSRLCAHPSYYGFISSAPFLSPESFSWPPLWVFPGKYPQMRNSYTIVVNAKSQEVVVSGWVWNPEGLLWILPLVFLRLVYSCHSCPVSNAGLKSQKPEWSGLWLLFPNHVCMGSMDLFYVEDLSYCSPVQESSMTPECPQDKVKTPWPGMQGSPKSGTSPCSSNALLQLDLSFNRPKLAPTPTYTFAYACSALPFATPTCPNLTSP